jgi:uncharacterized protein (DUF433 family)
MQTEATVTNGTGINKPQLVQEVYGGELYEYYPLGQYIVAAPGVCGGRPTFKYTRLEVSMILALLAKGETIDEIVADYVHSKITPEMVREAIQVAGRSLIASAKAIQMEVA